MKNKKRNKEKGLLLKSELFWDAASKKEQNEAEKLAEEYKDFLNKAKTERLTVGEIIRLATKEGYREIDLDQNLPAGAKKFIFNNRNKSLVLVNLSKKGLAAGLRLLLAHLDSPRLDLKVRPLYEDGGLAFLKSHYYGGIKKYQWPAIPLSMIGAVVLKSGKEIEIKIGEEKDDPVFLITDLLPHLDRSAMEKVNGSHEIKAEELNIVVGTKPVVDKEAKDRIKMAVLEWLNKNYKMNEEDFLTADIRFVPSWQARDSGFDRSMIAGYGQDNKAGTYTALRAFLKAKENETKLLYYSDKEEIGSDGSTGAKSLWLENVLDYLIRQTKTTASLYDVYRRTEAISSDTTAALDPDYKDRQDMLNAVYLGKGVVIEKHLGLGGKYYSVDSEPKFIRKIIDLFKEHNVLWQTGHVGKIDEHRIGGTVAVYLANRNVEVLDIGPALLNTHSPYEISSKGDIYSAYKAYKVFLEN